MNADVFVDTNILLYTIDEDAASASKRQRSQQLLLTGALGMVGPGSSRVFCQRDIAQTPVSPGQRRCCRSVGDLVRVPDIGTHVRAGSRCDQLSPAISGELLGRCHLGCGEANGLSNGLQ